MGVKIADKAQAATSAAPAVQAGEGDGLDEILSEAAGLDLSAASSSEQTASSEEEETAAAEETTETDEDDEGSESEEAEEEESSEEEEKLDGVSEKVQAKIQKRIDKLTARAKQAEEKLEKQKLELEEAQEAENRPSEPVLDIQPEYLSKEEAGQITQYQQLTQAEAWLLDNLDGYDGSGTADDPSWEASDVRKRYMQVQQEKAKLAPTAEQLMQERRALMQKDLAEGRRLRLEREQLKTTKKPSGKKPPAGAVTTHKKQVKKPPLTPKARAGFDQKALMEEGPTPEGLEAAFEAALD